MALVSVPNGLYFPLGPAYWAMQTATQATVATMDAATEKGAFVGRVFFSNRASGAKVLSAAGGGSISFRLGTTTFANGATTVEVGLQDVSGTGPPGQPDGTFDVSVVLTGGGGGLTTADWNTVPMTGGSGSKSLSHGDKIAVVLDMTARGGADSVILQGGQQTRFKSPIALPFVGGTWGVGSATATPTCLLTFDDGTLAILDDGYPWSTISSEAYSDATDPDERGNLFQVPWDCKIDGYWLNIANSSATTSDLTLALYSTPTGTPAAVSGSEFTIAAETFYTTNGRGYWLPLPAEIELSKNTDYCLAAKATGAGTITFPIGTLDDAAYRVFLPGTTTLSKATRNGGTGSFSPVTTIVYQMCVRISAFEEASSGGAGGTGSRMLRGAGI